MPRAVRGGKRGRFFGNVKRFPLFSVIFAAAALAAVVLFIERAERPDRPAAPSMPRKEVPRKGPAAGTSAARSAEPTPPTARQGRPLSVIIDDIGNDLRMLDAMIAIPAPIAFAVLPHTPHAAAAAEVLHAAGREILLHLPMEPRSQAGGSPGRGALTVDMDEQQIRRQIGEHLSSVPHVSGVNNHMGSRFMEDEARLAVVMRELAVRGLYFVDSRTTPATKGREAAGREGVRFAARGLFIDHRPGYAAALENLIDASRQHPSGDKPLLMIGHPHPETIRALRDALPVWQAAGVRLVALPTFLRMVEEQNQQGAAATGTAPASGRKDPYR